jgi:hypothetical protein
MPVSSFRLGRSKLAMLVTLDGRVIVGRDYSSGEVKSIWTDEQVRDRNRADYPILVGCVVVQEGERRSRDTGGNVYKVVTSSHRMKGEFR